MMSNVKKKDVPLISISLVAILFIAAALSLFPQQSADEMCIRDSFSYIM